MLSRKQAPILAFLTAAIDRCRSILYPFSEGCKEVAGFCRMMDMRSDVPLIDARTLPLRESTSFVVFDLEWNQCPYGKTHEVPELPFEIIDIGAVKLDRHLQIIDTFQCFIRPTIYRALHFQTRKVIDVQMNELQNGLSFPEAARDFLSFCGTDYIFCTWGDQDISELERNLAFYDMLDLLPGPLIYEDVQKLFAISYESRPRRRSLSSATDFLHIDINLAYHRALDDAIYTAAVLQKIPEECIIGDFSLDTFQHPKGPSDELRMRLKGCEKYITREFRNTHHALQDPEVSALRCIICGEEHTGRTEWLAKGRRQYIAYASCPVHGPYFARVRVKSGTGSNIYVEKVTKCMPVGP